MSRPEVNLLSAGLLPPPERLPLALFGKLALAGAVLATVVTLYGEWQISTAKAEIAVLQKQAASAKAEVAQLISRNNRQSEKVALNRDLEQLVGLQQEQLATLSLLERESSGIVRANASSYFVGVAEAHVPGLWITQVAVDLRTEALQISGAAETPNRIPNFLTQLRATSAFAASSVGGLEMRVTESGPVDFQLKGAAG